MRFLRQTCYIKVKLKKTKKSLQTQAFTMTVHWMPSYHVARPLCCQCTTNVLYLLYIGIKKVEISIGKGMTKTSSSPSVPRWHTCGYSIIADKLYLFI